MTVDHAKVKAVLVGRQIKDSQQYNKSHRVKSQRALVLGERCWGTGTKNEWLDCYITGIDKENRCYQVVFDLQPLMPFQGQRQQSSERRIMTMCLIRDRLPIAVRLTAVAHWRAALTPGQPRGLMRQQIQPPARPVAVLQAAMAQLSQTAHQAPHHLQDGPGRHVLRRLCQPRFQADHLHHLC